MIRRLLIAVMGIAFAHATPALAQSDSSAEFCTASPNEALQALDGAWRITQGAGTALARTSQGSMPLPLPGHPPKSVSMDYDPLSGTALLEGAAPDEMLLLLPSNGEGAQIAVDTLEQDGSGPTAQNGCNWASLPLMIGSNVYELRPGPQSPSNGVFGQIMGMSFGYCYNGSADGSNSNLLIFEGGFAPVPVYGSEGESELCNPPAAIPEPASGQMIMTMIVRFDSLNSGSGVLKFEGEQGDARFSATAPISFSR